MDRKTIDLPLSRVDGVVVLDGRADGEVALHGEDGGHVDGAAEGDVVQGVQHVAERHVVEVRRAELAPETDSNHTVNKSGFV